MKPTSELVRDDPAQFMARLWIDADGQRKLYGPTMDPWQRTDMAALYGGLQRAAGRKPTHPVHKWVWYERPRGHSKTSDQSAAALYWLNATTRPLRAYCVAGDRDQAGLLLDSCRTLKAMNPHLAVDVGRDRVINRASGAELQVMSSDEATSWGLLPALLIADEISVWPESSEGLLYSLLSSAAKRESCMFVAVGNAGRQGTWQWQAREQARQSPDWHFNALQGCQASWISARTLDQQKRFLPPHEYGRVWCNIWSDGANDYLDAHKIDACVTLRAPMYQKPPGEWHFTAGLDLGVRRDRSSLVVLATERKSNRVALAWCESWRPTDANGEIDLSLVESAVVRAHKRYHLQAVHADQWQATLLVQNLRRAGVPAESVHYTPKNVTEMTMALLETFSNETISLYPDEQLITDLKRLQIEPTLSGTYKLTASRDRDGHCDAAFALALALPHALRLAGAVAAQPAKPQHYRQKISPERFGVQIDFVGNRAHALYQG